jgi:pyrimidine operon attenuation protein/uracil phosphoribosyltransferase
MAHEILERQRGAEDVLLIGLHTRGAHLASRLAIFMADVEGREVAFGTLDISRHRDDHAIRESGSPKSTRIPESLDGKTAVIVDDVLYTGRTVRAALDALSDIGRARHTQLAVLIDRGHRELPIRADYVGKNMPTSERERVTVRVIEEDGVDGVWIEDTAT